MEYQDFQILVDKNNNIRASSEQGDEFGVLSLDMNEIEDFVNEINTTYGNF